MLCRCSPSFNDSVPLVRSTLQVEHSPYPLPPQLGEREQLEYLIKVCHELSVRIRVKLNLSLLAVPSTPPRLPLRAPSNWRIPKYRPVPHLSVIKEASYSHLFQTRTRWIARALSQGQHIPRNLLYKVLRTRKLSPDTLASWVDILNTRDPIYALGKLGLLESASQADEISTRTTTEEEDDKNKPQCPDWLYLSIPAMVSSQQQAPYLVSQILSNRFSVQLPERSRSMFLARCIQAFLKVKHHVALREVIEFIVFSRTEAEPNNREAGGGPIWREQSYGRILEALASERQRSGKVTSAPTELLHSLRDLLLGTMKERQVSRRSLVTWLPLFSPSLISQDPRQAVETMMEMARETGLQPKRRVLHQVLKVVVRKGGIENREAAEKIKEELSRAKAGATPSQWMRTQLPDRTDSVPLHLREGKGKKASLEDWELEEIAIEEEEVEAQRGEEMVMEVGTRELGRESVKLETLNPQEALKLSALSRSSSSPPLTTTTRPLRKSPAVQSEIPTSLANDIYRTTQLFDRSTSLAYFAQLRQYVASSGRSSTFPRPPFLSSRVAWAALFQSVVHEFSVDHKFLVAVLDKLERASASSSTSSTTSYIPPAPTLRLYTIVMHCLLLRHAPGHVTKLFDKLRNRGYPLDATVLDLQVRALCIMRKDKEAYRLLRYYEHLPSIHDPSSLVSLRTPPAECMVRRRHSVRLDIVPWNSLLSHYNLVGKYQRVYSLYKELELKHEVRPDIATMSILLDAARYASTEAGRGSGGFGMEDGIGQVNIGGKRTSRSFGGRLQPRVLAADSRVGGAVDDRWDRVPAAKRMEELVWDQLFEANYQEVEVENPLETKTGVGRWLQAHFSPSGSSSSSSSASRTRRAQSFADQLEPPHNWRPFISTLSPRQPLHPDVYPTDQFFRSLILLTGVHSHIPLIGQILAWARYTNVKLSRYTLCLALLYVDGDAGIKRDGVEKFRKWLSNWLGDENVPDEDEIAWMRRGGTTKGKPELR
ncbi:hypothetical protein JCM5350_003106 [Sporobolomyces pararoseus]